MRDSRKAPVEGQEKMKSAAAAVGKLTAPLGLNVLARWIYDVLSKYML